MDLPRLPARPKAQVLSIADVLEYAKAGRFRIPDFQTGLRWEARHVRELFDSILRGFPVGGLLLWQRETSAELLRFGPVTIEATARPDALFVVDGQQRITAIVGAMLHPEANPLGGAHAVWVDLEQGSFAVRRDEAPRHWLPLNVLGDRPRLHQWARSLQAGPATEALVGRAFEIETTLMKYELPAYVVHNADRRALELIFNRVNNAGVPLKEAEVFEALFGRGASTGQSSFQQMSAELGRETGFGPLSPSLLLRCAKAVEGLDAHREFTEDYPPSHELLSRTTDALRRTITFLQRDTGLIHASLLPYRLPLIVLARLFDLHRTPDPRNLVLLVRWIWRGAVSGVHTDSNNVTINAHLRDLDSDEHRSVQRLLARVPKKLDLPDPLGDWYGGGASTRLYAALLLDEEPLFPATDETMTREALLALLTGRSLGQLFKPVSGVRSSAIAARVFWPSPARVAFLGRPPEFAHSHVISERALAALEHGDPDEFLAARVNELKHRMDSLIQRLAAPKENDHPVIRHLLAS